MTNKILNQYNLDISNKQSITHQMQNLITYQSQLKYK